jgi:hypothetical protein
MFSINVLRAFSRTWPKAGLVGMPGHFYQHHLSPTLSPIQSNGGEGGQGVLDGGWFAVAAWHFNWIWASKS